MERVLRDHSQSCKHAPDGYKKVWGDGFHIGHEYQWAPAHHAWCPGGREVTDEQIGWFNPDSKRFCYTDEKEHDRRHLGHSRFASYTEPVFTNAALPDLEV